MDKTAVTKIFKKICNFWFFHFHARSLEKLASFMPRETILYLESQFSMEKTVSKNDLLKSKNVYPYLYMETIGKFSGEKLLPKEFWENTLESGEVTTFDGDLVHSNLVFHAFECKTLGNNHDLYLGKDVLILVSVFGGFGKVCYATHNLNWALFSTASILSGEAVLEVYNAEIEHSTNREHLEMAENLIRGEFLQCLQYIILKLILNIYQLMTS